MAAEIGLVVRSRGVGTRLLGRDALERLADAGDVAALARGLERLGTRLEPFGESPDVEALERSARRTAGRHLRTLAAWQRRQPGVLDVFFADADRRSLRALVRGSLQGAPTALRLAGLLPTPTLPVAVLAELARQPSPSAVVGHLALMRYPGARRLAPLVSKAQPDLFRVEVELLALAAERAAAAARRADSVMRDFVEARVDVGNVQNALLLAGEPLDTDPASVFVAGGRWLAQAAFQAAAAAPSRQASLATLHTALASTPLSGVLPVVPSDAAAVERAFLTSTLDRLARLERVDPLGSAPLLRVLLRIEAQSRDLGTLAWGAAFGAPAAMRRQELVTPWH
jgi:vacuolar-type H+-ATPase subunit C/Vma6